MREQLANKIIGKAVKEIKQKPMDANTRNIYWLIRRVSNLEVHYAMDEIAQILNRRFNVTRKR